MSFSYGHKCGRSPPRVTGKRADAAHCLGAQVVTSHTWKWQDVPNRELYLPNSQVNSPAYWNSEQLYVQPLVSRMQLSSLSITVSMRFSWNVLQKLGTDAGSSSSFLPLHDKRHPFDQPGVFVHVYHFSKEIIKDLAKNSEEYFGFRCVGVACNL